MTMNAEEIPTWVPSAVKKLAVMFQFEEELVRRLVTDPTMKNVWQYLRRAQPVSSEIADIDSEFILKTWGVSDMGVSVQEQACALFFWRVVIEMCVPRTATTGHDIANLVAPLHSATEQCRSGMRGLGLSADGELAKALSLSAEYFDFKARVAGEDVNSPYTLKRRSGKPEDDTVRGRVRALAWTTHALYGLFQYGILASVATVALQTNITRKDVRNWCSDLPVAREESAAR
jgi:hypothetical protein